MRSVVGRSHGKRRSGQEIHEPQIGSHAPLFSSLARAAISVMTQEITQIFSSLLPQINDDLVKF